MKFFSVSYDKKQRKTTSEKIRKNIQRERVVIKIANKWRKKSNIATLKISFQRNLPVIVWKTSALLCLLGLFIFFKGLPYLFVLIFLCAAFCSRN